MSTSAIVLCGGRSERMGRDKASLPFGDGTLLTHVAGIASSITPIVVVAANMTQVVPPGLSVVRDAADGQGPLSALAGALRQVRPGRAIVLSCDAPLVMPAVLRLLLSRLGEADASVPRIGGVAMPTCAVYATRIQPRAAALIDDGRRSLQALLDAIAVEWVEEDELRRLDPELLGFRDCDTPDEYRALLSRASSVTDRGD